MRTTIDIDRKLLERAKRALNARTYREAVERALEDALARSDLERATAALEGSDLSWDLEELLSYRRLKRGDSS
ncbi:MAG: type II toxin-antitoxin system VapB family antitoxin [Gemmatimonadota bacterium]